MVNVGISFAWKIQLQAGDVGILCKSVGSISKHIMSEGRYLVYAEGCSLHLHGSCHDVSDCFDSIQLGL